ncbi:MAG: hypothetical protein Q4C35_09510, partial [Eubacteriales bacterium]|nr:hypothetical protein [Eubacteriales bacterium]
KCWGLVTIFSCRPGEKQGSLRPLALCPMPGRHKMGAFFTEIRPNPTKSAATRQKVQQKYSFSYIAY